ncbi:CD5 antigen-like [Alosa pseudoharengus]|uniref:CD5 antigen-like n=1 Tax=Alosa pseudoharengus TaxID=34774 RepID=UPI003F88DD25
MKFSSKTEMLMAVLALLSVLSFNVPSVPVAAQIRLVNGTSGCSGRVEVYLSNQWGTVCDDDWDMSDAEVVCRQLGCGTAVCAPGSAYYGAGTGEVWMGDVACSGIEQSLTQCSYNSTHNCTHHQDAGVVCSMAGPSISLISSYSAVSAGETVQISCSRSAYQCTGNLLLFRNGANVNSKSLNSSQSSATFTLSNVDSSHQGSYTCAYSSSSTHSRSISITVVTARLVNGTSGCSGRVEVYLSNQWGTVCDDDWDMSDTEVVCRQLGCGTAVCAPGSAYYGAGTGEVWMGDVACSGIEQSLQCSYNSTHNCRHHKDAGVVCSMEGPSISLISSYSAVSAGETVQIRCSTSANQCNGNLFLYRNGVNVNSKALSSYQSNATFTLSNVDSYHQGSYTCAYSSYSTHSRSINITVASIITPGVNRNLFLRLVIPAILYLVKKVFCQHNGSPDEDEKIHMNTVMPTDQRDRGEDTGDLEEI